ncbi:MAG: baseplate J/gp47 family protein [Nitrospirota bacterium]|nr:baseplate J/gp47 family protein [Nitrospirota bacterium]
MSYTYLGPTIGATGISAPSYQTILTSLQGMYQAIFGSDVYLGSDSQDGQFLAIIAQAISDLNSAAISVYNNQSPATAQGGGLSSIVKINGLQREIPSNSTAVCTVVGQAGTTITNGQAVDTNGNIWLLPSPVVIPPAGSLSVTTTAQNAGAISAGPGAINGIDTPTYGWQSITNPAAATPGAPVETDGALRARQSNSVAGPAQSILAAIGAALANVPGVTNSFVYENATSSTDSNGVPAGAISPIVLGGTTTDIGNAILSRKPPGVPTYGTTEVTVFDSNGIPVVLNYFVLAQTGIYAALTVKALPGWLASTIPLIQNAMAQFVSNYYIGQELGYFDLLSPANLTGDAAIEASALTNNGIPLTQTQLDAIKATYRVESLTIGTAPNPSGITDIPIAFNAAAQLTPANVAINVS